MQPPSFREPTLPSSTNRSVLITQLPDDAESVHALTHSSDTRSEVTHHSHVIDSPIYEVENEEEEEDVEEGRFSRKSVMSRASRFGLQNSGEGRSRLDQGEDGGDDGGREKEEEEEEEESCGDSMFLDNVSDVFSGNEDEPVELKDEDFDTDLEMDDDKWLNPERYDHDTTGLTKYLNACEQNDVTPVRYFIKHMLDVQMNLGHHGIGPSEMKALAVPLESNTSIERLDLEGNWIELVGVHHLCRVLKENVFIVQLNLGENRLGDTGVHKVLDLLLENRTIEWLDLTGNNLTDNSAETLCQVLKKNNTLRHLKLRHNELGEQGAPWMKETLSDNISLESLDISWNHFLTPGCVLLAEGLKENVGLKELNLSMNGFSLEGSVALGEAIKHNRTLLHLDCSYCRLPGEGSLAIAQGLKDNDTLQTLNVGFNSLGPEGCLVLLNGLDGNDCSSLNILDLGKTRVTPEFQTLQEKLEEARPLRVLHGGVMLITQLKELQLDPVEAFKRDPMTKLKEWVQQAGYRLIDLLRHFDKDNSFTISREEFTNGIKGVGIDITDQQIEILLDRLDTDGDGEIDFRELVQGDNDHRSLRRDLWKFEEDQQRMRDEEKHSGLEVLLKKPQIQNSTSPIPRF